MRRRLGTGVLAVSMLTVGTVLAQAGGGPAAAPGQAGAAPSGASPQASEPAAPAPSPVHPGIATTLAQDESGPASDLPPGTVEVTLLDERNKPLANSAVRLGIVFERIAEGESRSERFLTTNDAGKARFEGLSKGSEYSYRVTAKRGAGNYASAPFNLRDTVGQRVLLHAYSASSSLKDTLIGMRGFIYIEPREDVFQFEVLFRVFNVGDVSWVPDSVVLRLPSGFKAFRASEGMFDARFEALEGRGVRLLGTYPPGQRDVSFRFQVPRENQEFVEFGFGMLPHVAELRVLAEASSRTTLEVPGFEPAESATTQSGQRVLVTRRLMDVESATKIGEITVRLAGLPVPGIGRWVAVVIAFGMALVGLKQGRSGATRKDEKARRSELVEAREVLLKELIALEKAFRGQQLGPRAHEEAQRKLLDALARIERSASASPASSALT